MCATCNEQNGCKNVMSVAEDRKNAVEVCFLNDPRALSQLPNVSNMSKSSPLHMVYRRRKSQGDSVAILEQAQEDTYQSVSSHHPAEKNELPRASLVDHVADICGDSVMPSFVCSRKLNGFEQEHLNGCSGCKSHGSGEALKSMNQLKTNSTNDSCSSSKLNSDPISVSMRTEVGDAGECSSSGTIMMEDREIELSTKELCISILRSGGQLGGIRSKRRKNPVEDTVRNRSCSRSCKICGNSETTLKMLICDNCEEAFHVTCCNTRIKKILDEWFCSSCLKSKRKVFKETCVRKSLNISSEIERCGSPSDKDESNHVALMLEDTVSYRSNVRVGKGFQADTPEWLGPAYKNVDAVSEPLEIDTSVGFSLHKWSSAKNSRFSSISNWLQCREIIKGVGGVNETICGKWRRAPLSEVQTKNWECFCSILWDPTHADCAVPQELETDEVLKQLKYIEMLRPRLAAKRRKMNCVTTGNMQDFMEHPTNTQLPSVHRAS